VIVTWLPLPQAPQKIESPLLTAFFSQKMLEEPAE
jgi:hypothetical protein